MGNSFRPKYSKESINKVGDLEIAVKKVNNSQFDLYTDVANTEKNKAVRLTEKNLRKVVENKLMDYVGKNRKEDIFFR